MKRSLVFIFLTIALLVLIDYFSADYANARAQAKPISPKKTKAVNSQIILAKNNKFYKGSEKILFRKEDNNTGHFVSEIIWESGNPMKKTTVIGSWIKGENGYASLYYFLDQKNSLFSLVAVEGWDIPTIDGNGLKEEVYSDALHGIYPYELHLIKNKPLYLERATKEKKKHLILKIVARFVFVWNLVEGTQEDFSLDKAGVSSIIKDYEKDARDVLSRLRTKNG